MSDEEKVCYKCEGSTSGYICGRCKETFSSYEKYHTHTFDSHHICYVLPRCSGCGRADIKCDCSG